MKKDINNSGVESACASTAAARKKDKYVGRAEFQVMEAKLFKRASGYMPAYKVRVWSNETSEPIWFCGGFFSKKEWGEEVNETVLREFDTFFYGGLPQINELFQPTENRGQKLAKECADFMKENNEAIEFIKWRCDELFSISLEDKTYVGLDLWLTPKGLKYSLAGSNWLYVKEKDGRFCLRVDDIALETMGILKHKN